MVPGFKGKKNEARRELKVLSKAESESARTRFWSQVTRKCAPLHCPSRSVEELWATIFMAQHMKDVFRTE